MELAMNAHITFTSAATGKVVSLRKPSACKIESSWKLLTDIASITLAKQVRDFDNTQVSEVFRRGDKVNVQLGYNGILLDEYSGYITTVSADAPIEIKLEDNMWKLKQVPVNISLNKTTLNKLLAAIVPTEFNIDAVEFNIGSVRFANMTVATVLDKIKSEFGLYSYFVNDTLVCGKIYEDNNEAVVQINLDKWALPEHSLKFKKAEDQFIKVKAISTLTDGTKVEAEYGDEGGDEQQLTYFNIESKATLKELAKNDYNRLKVDKLEGDFTTFGQPNLKHGQKIELISDINKELNGIYFVESVSKDFDSSPQFHQRVTIGGKAA